MVGALPCATATFNVNKDWAAVAHVSCATSGPPRAPTALEISAYNRQFESQFDCKSAKISAGSGPSRAAQCQPQFTMQLAKGLAAVVHVTCAADTMFVMELWGSVTARTWIVSEPV